MKNIPHPAFDNDSGFSVTAKNTVKQELKEVDSGLKKKKIDEALNKKKDKGLASLDKYMFTALAIGEKAYEYIVTFKKINKGKLIIPSKPAGMFGLSWLLYRNTALHGVIFYLMLISISYNVITKLCYMLPNISQIALILLIPHVVLYFVGNLIYLYSVRKKVSKAKEKYGTSGAISYLSNHGGTIKGLALLSTIVMLQGGVLFVLYSLFYFDGALANSIEQFLSMSKI